MEIKSVFLERFVAFGKQEGYFTYEKIANIPSSCCTALSQEIIDFDKTEEVHRKKHNAMELCSCDLLHINAENASVTFIEMKGLKHFLEEFEEPENRVLLPKHSKKKHFTKKKATEKVDSFPFMDKIRDSLLILSNIVNSPKFTLNDEKRKAVQSEYYTIPQYFIILTDINIEDNPNETFKLAMFRLEEIPSTKAEILAVLLQEKVDALTISSFSNIQKPILATCDTLHKHLR